MALLKAKTGSSSLSRWVGILLRSVSSPTQRTDFFLKIVSTSCCLFIRLMYFRKAKVLFYLPGHCVPACLLAFVFVCIFLSFRLIIAGVHYFIYLHLFLY